MIAPETQYSTLSNLDGHVGDGEEVVELDAEGFVQLFLVLRLKRRLPRDNRRHGTARQSIKSRFSPKVWSPVRAGMLGFSPGGTLLILRSIILLILLLVY